jgi:DNA-binding transcriptional ArsR family regulator
MTETEAVRRLSALAQETRLKIFRRLVEAGPDGLPAGTLASGLAVSPSNLSAHLGTLSQAGLVIARPRGRQRIYAADMTVFSDLLRFLVADCCNGRPEICTPLIDALREAR